MKFENMTENKEFHVKFTFSPLKNTYCKCGLFVYFRSVSLQFDHTCQENGGQNQKGSSPGCIRRASRCIYSMLNPDSVSLT